MFSTFSNSNCILKLSSVRSTSSAALFHPTFPDFFCRKHISAKKGIFHQLMLTGIVFPYVPMLYQRCGRPYSTLQPRDTTRISMIPENNFVNSFMFFSHALFIVLSCSFGKPFETIFYVRSNSFYLKVTNIHLHFQPIPDANHVCILSFHPSSSCSL